MIDVVMAVVPVACKPMHDGSLVALCVCGVCAMCYVRVCVVPVVCVCVCVSWRCMRACAGVYLTDQVIVTGMLAKDGL